MLNAFQQDEDAARPVARTDETGTLRVLMLGPALGVRGGVSAVEQALMAALPASVRVTHVATMTEGSKWRKLLIFARAAIATVRQLRQQPDLVHIHFASDASSTRKIVLARLALARGAKVIMHAHGGGYRAYWPRMSGAARAATLASLRRVHRLIVLGESWREFFASVGVPRQNIVVLPNPVELPKILPERLARAQVRLVYLGLISRRKGAFDLVDAAARLPAACLERARIVLAGNGETTSLRECVERRGLGRVIEVRGWIGAAERDQLLASADAFVLPSYAEGLPMSLLEAMAWGLPPICTAVGSIPEYVQHGVDGMLVQPGDIEALARSLEHIVMNDAQRVRMGRLARAAVEPLSLDLYAKKMAALYRSVAAVGEQASESCRRS